MPTRYLSAQQRKDFGRFSAPVSNGDLAKHFTLDEIDLRLIQKLRSPETRLGYAALLTSVRFIGMFPETSAGVPDPVVCFLRTQLGLTNDIGFGGYFQSRTFERHIQSIRAQHSLVYFADAARIRVSLTKWIYSECWAGNERPGALVLQAADWLIANKVILPGVSTLERLVGRIWERAQLRLWHRLVNGLSEVQRGQIAALFDNDGARLWRTGKTASYGPFDTIAEGTINTNLIAQNWEDLIRLAGSLKLGHLKAAGVMRILQVRERPTTLAKALVQLGRLIKTLHILNYIDDAAFRRRILVQLNRQEFRHKLARKIYHGERGEVRNALRQGQEEQLGALGIALNAITHWNAIYMQKALGQLSDQGLRTDPADIARLSPILWRHINFLGRYDFALPETVAQGGLRPLRNNTSEWEL